MRITQNMMSRNVLRDINGASERAAETNARISSGKAISKPSDDPFGTARAMSLHASLDGVRQYQSNISDATGWQNATESALDTITKSAQRVRELAVQGGSETISGADRNAAADEV